ncbi:MAG: type II secretion system F family protein [Kiloniellales bacterium]
MAQFRYRALAPSGEITEGVMDAPDQDAVVSRLRANDHLPIRAVPLDQPDAVGAETTATPPPRRRPRWRRRIGPGAVAVFSREMHTLLDAGLTADRALWVIAETSANPGLAGVAGELRERVHGGAALSEAMAEHGEVFGPFYRAMVRAGEAGGSLEVTLEALASYLERTERLVASIRSALIYPTILVTAAGISVLILMTLVVPQFELLFRETAAEIPWITRLVVALSQFLRGYGWILALVGLAVWLMLRLRWRSPAARARRDAWLLRLPVTSSLVARIEVERFARSLATLLANGVPLPAALELSGAVANNQVIAGAVASAVERVKQGERLAGVLQASGVMPPLAVQLIQVGEESGQLEAMLLKLADGYAQEVEVSLKRLVALVEPLLILFIGGLVALVVVSLFAALFGVNALVV